MKAIKIALLPDGRALVTERAGRVRLLTQELTLARAARSGRRGGRARCASAKGLSNVEQLVAGGASRQVITVAVSTRSRRAISAAEPDG
jgi:hypothetical protein